jgi:ribonucleoside-diphosphate reductase beta chain
VARLPAQREALLGKFAFVSFETALACEVQFAEDLLGGGIAGLSVPDVKCYLEYCADQRLATLGFDKRYGTKNPFSFMAQHDVQEVGPEGVLWR